MSMSKPNTLKIGAIKLSPIWLLESKKVKTAGSSAEHSISITLWVSFTGPVCTSRQPAVKASSGHDLHNPKPPMSSSCRMQATKRASCALLVTRT
eukprot:8481853-Pyramimonas_sp.AAC.1